MRDIAVASAVAAAAAVLAQSRGAAAQVHWDAGLGVGVIQRVTSGGEADPGAHVPTPMLGPVAELRAHVAVLPMLRAGPYLSHDISPVTGRPAREMTAAGLRFKITPPLAHPPFHVWAFAGLGYVRAYAPSYLAGPSDRVPGMGGGILEMPFGIGAGVKLRGPWALFAELGARVGWLFSGSMYRRPQCPCDDSYLGKDSFAAALSVGVSLEQ